MVVDPFPAAAGPQQPHEGLSVAVAVDRYLDGIQSATTRASYAETLARVTAIAGLAPRPPCSPGTTRR